MALESCESKKIKIMEDITTFGPSFKFAKIYLRPPYSAGCAVFGCFICSQHMIFFSHGKYCCFGHFSYEVRFHKFSVLKRERCKCSLEPKFRLFQHSDISMNGEHHHVVQNRSHIDP